MVWMSDEEERDLFTCGSVRDDSFSRDYGTGEPARPAEPEIPLPAPQRMTLLGEYLDKKDYDGLLSCREWLVSASREDEVAIDIALLVAETLTQSTDPKHAKGAARLCYELLDLDRHANRRGLRKNMEIAARLIEAADKIDRKDERKDFFSFVGRAAETLVKKVGTLSEEEQALVQAVLAEGRRRYWLAGFEPDAAKALLAKSPLPQRPSWLPATKDEKEPTPES